jgi:hypothetical protein
MELEQVAKPDSRMEVHFRQKAIAALIVNPRVSDAAKAIGISPITLGNWMTREDFVAEYRAARERVLDQTAAILTTASEMAAACLIRNLECEDANLEIKAAQAVLQLTSLGIGVYGQQSQGPQSVKVEISFIDVPRIQTSTTAV